MTADRLELPAGWEEVPTDQGPPLYVRTLPAGAGYLSVGALLIGREVAAWTWAHRRPRHVAGGWIGDGPGPLETVAGSDRPTAADAIARAELYRADLARPPIPTTQENTP